jgi:hypothetical protein
MRWTWVLLFATLFAAHAVAGTEPRPLDDFTDLASWRIITAEGVHLSTHPDTSDGVPAIRLDYEFITGGGYCIIRKPIALDLPENYELAFHARGAGPPQNLEFKLVSTDSAGGDTVWWVNRRAFEFPPQRTRLAQRGRNIEFAWGPGGAGNPLTRTTAIEFAIASHSGGKGSVWLDSLTFRELPPVRPYTGSPKAASTTRLSPEHDAMNVVAPDAALPWRPEAGRTIEDLDIDFGQTREFGGVLIRWEPGRHARHVTILASDDAAAWTHLWSGDDLPGVPLLVPTPDAQARRLRISLEGPAAGEGFGVRAVRALDPSFSSSDNELWRQTAAEFPRGAFPRAFSGEQPWWTVVGLPEDNHEALINIDGAVEVVRQGFSIEPFVLIEGPAPRPTATLSWAEAQPAASLAGGFLPIPTVTREASDLRLTVTALADGVPGDAHVLVLYELTNTGVSPASGRLALALRPFQVNPPWQFLNTPGGVARVSEIRRDGADLIVNGATRVSLLGAPAGGPPELVASTADRGEIVTRGFRGTPIESDPIIDPRRAASAAMLSRFALAPGQTASWVIGAPFAGMRRPDGWPDPARADAGVPHFESRLDAQAQAWFDLLARVRLTLPPEADELVDTMRANLAWVLINRDGPGFQPGSRSYERSWIRDGSMTSAALLELGLVDEVRRFAEWYAPFQFESGKVPCVVDRRGPDPVPEHDSHGQLVWLIANVYRHTGDAAWLERMFPHVERAVEYVRALRAQRLTPEFTDPASTSTRQEPGKPPVPARAFAGLVPESISHEGYSAKPMHSHWDSFFVLRGLEDAAELARALGRTAQADDYAALADDYRAALLNAIDLGMRAHAIDYIPGCVELGDFDATSTTVALWPSEQTPFLPAEALRRTFDKYWENFLRRRDDPAFAWHDYTPYELRVVQAFVRLGQRDHAHQALDFFLRDRHPDGWRHWAEIVHKDRNAAKWIGDMPHTWVGSDFLNSFCSLFVHEDRRAGTLVLFAGVPRAWADSPQGVAFDGFRTPFGPVAASLRTQQGVYRVIVGGGLKPPPGGVVLRLPLDAPPARVLINGQPATTAGADVVLTTLPADVVIVPAP